uniref:hypothetical protein n=1 Tax=Acetatifactor sp. TaxID=1872090 RepID=UPI00402866E2
IERTGRREEKKLIKPREDQGSGAQRAKTGRLYPRKRNRPGMGSYNRPTIPREKKPAGYREAQ